jgi:hypothetical protein
MTRALLAVEYALVPSFLRSNETKWPPDNLDAAAQFQNCSCAAKEITAENSRNGDHTEKSTQPLMDGCVLS